MRFSISYGFRRLVTVGILALTARPVIFLRHLFSVPTIFTQLYLAGVEQNVNRKINVLDTTGRTHHNSKKIRSTTTDQKARSSNLFGCTIPTPSQAGFFFGFERLPCQRNRPVQLGLRGRTPASGPDTARTNSFRVQVSSRRFGLFDGGVARFLEPFGRQWPRIPASLRVSWCVLQP